MITEIKNVISRNVARLKEFVDAKIADMGKRILQIVLPILQNANQRKNHSYNNSPSQFQRTPSAIAPAQASQARQGTDEEKGLDATQADSDSFPLTEDKLTQMREELENFDILSEADLEATQADSDLLPTPEDDLTEDELNQLREELENVDTGESDIELDPIPTTDEEAAALADLRLAIKDADETLSSFRALFSKK